MKSINMSLILLFISLAFYACNGQEYKVGDCIQRPDDVSAYKVEKVSDGKFELLNLATQEIELFDSVNGFVKSACQ